jgi:hypothetical protein
MVGCGRTNGFFAKLMVFRLEHFVFVNRLPNSIFATLDVFEHENPSNTAFSFDMEYFWGDMKMNVFCCENIKFPQN